MLNPEKLLAALNALNSPPVPFTLENVVLSTPQPYVGNAPWNTKITATAMPGEGYSSSMDFYYHRIDLSEMGVVEIASRQPFTVDNILVVLNNLNTAAIDTRADLTLADLEEVTLPTFSPNGDAQTITLDAHDTSIGWIGVNKVLLAYNLPDVGTLINFYNTEMATAFPAQP